VPAIKLTRRRSDGPGARCSEQFAEELRRRAAPNEFVLEVAGAVAMEDGVERMTYRLG